MAKNLAEAILEEQKRVRELSAEYRALPNGVGIIGATMMDNCLKKVERAAIEQDTIGMLALLQELQGFE